MMQKSLFAGDFHPVKQLLVAGRTQGGAGKGLGFASLEKSRNRECAG